MPPGCPAGRRVEVLPGASAPPRRRDHAALERAAVLRARDDFLPRIAALLEIHSADQLQVHHLRHELVLRRPSRSGGGPRGSRRATSPAPVRRGKRGPLPRPRARGRGAASMPTADRAVSSDPGTRQGRRRPSAPTRRTAPIRRSRPDPTFERSTNIDSRLAHGGREVARRAAAGSPRRAARPEASRAGGPWPSTSPAQALPARRQILDIVAQLRVQECTRVVARADSRPSVAARRLRMRPRVDRSNVTVYCYPFSSTLSSRCWSLRRSRRRGRPCRVVRRDPGLGAARCRSSSAIPAGRRFRAAALLHRARRSRGGPVQFELLARARAARRTIKAGSYALTSLRRRSSCSTSSPAATVMQAELRFIEGWTFGQLRAALTPAPSVRHDTASLSDEQILARLGAPEKRAESA